MENKRDNKSSQSAGKLKAKFMTDSQPDAS